ncbi:ankyrin repeat domain-containing protein 49-like [Oppia nitens]|uniref:ankyrin repeat domain-containing protein 49-like n=1 Tax=Oppia nitens TaxID=1686743 RepID=UPI0023DC492E|nr:ankyrin repeat domain-containing protein 49-like [Oppia nitens]
MISQSGESNDQRLSPNESNEKNGYNEQQQSLGDRILMAAENGDICEVKTCLKIDKSLVHSVDSDLYTPLHRSAYGNHIQVMKLLIDSGANPTARTATGWTPLHSAAQWAHIDAVDLLLNCGADINAVSDGGNTALHLAAKHKKRNLLELLLYNEDIDSLAKNDSGESAYDIAYRASPLYQLWQYL